MDAPYKFITCDQYQGWNTPNILLKYVAGFPTKEEINRLKQRETPFIERDGDTFKLTEDGKRTFLFYLETYPIVTNDPSEEISMVILKDPDVSEECLFYLNDPRGVDAFCIYLEQISDSADCKHEPHELNYEIIKCYAPRLAEILRWFEMNREKKLYGYVLTNPEFKEDYVSNKKKIKYSEKIDRRRGEKIVIEYGIPLKALYIDFEGTCVFCNKSMSGKIVVEKKKNEDIKILDSWREPLLKR